MFQFLFSILPEFEKWASMHQTTSIFGGIPLKESGFLSRRTGTEVVIYKRLKKDLKTCFFSGSISCFFSWILLFFLVESVYSYFSFWNLSFINSHLMIFQIQCPMFDWMNYSLYLNRVADLDLFRKYQNDFIPFVQFTSCYMYVREINKPRSQPTTLVQENWTIIIKKHRCNVKASE